MKNDPNEVKITKRQFKQVRDWAKHNEVDLRTVSFYQDLSVEQPDSEFGYCDISGKECMVSHCVALHSNLKDSIEFMAAEELIGTALGRLAGAF
jgi:hypothetical protein